MLGVPASAKVDLDCRNMGRSLLPCFCVVTTDPGKYREGMVFSGCRVNSYFLRGIRF